MAIGSVPNVGSRVNVQVFAGDLLAHQGLVSVESYTSSGYSSVVLSDGAGLKVALTGDHSQCPHGAVGRACPARHRRAHGRRVTMASPYNRRCSLCGQYIASAQVAEVGRPAATDLGQLQRNMVRAGVDPGALDVGERDALLRRYNRAAPGRRSTVELRSALDGQDLTARMEAAVELQNRGELDDATAR